MKILITVLLFFSFSLVTAQELIHQDENSGITIPSEFDLVNFELTIKRNGCFGPCPIYEVILKGNGSLQYIGKRHVSFEGKRSKQVESKIVKSVITRLFESNFFYFPHSYTDYIVAFEGKSATVLIQTETDIPMPFIEIKIGSFKKGFRSTPSAPLEARMLIDEIEKIINISEWINAEDK